MASAARYGVAARTAWVDADELGLDRAETYVANLPSGPPLLLEGAAWAVWRALTEGGSLVEIVQQAAELTDSDPVVISAEVTAFVEELIDRGLAERQPAS